MLAEAGMRQESIEVVEELTEAEVLKERGMRKKRIGEYDHSRKGAERKRTLI